MSLDSPVTPAAQATVRAQGAQGAEAEWTARPLRPVAHWVLMPDEGGRNRLTCVWEVPNPIPPA